MTDRKKAACPGEGAGGSGENSKMSEPNSIPKPALWQDPSQSDLADIFVARVGYRSRYCHARRMWLVHDADGWRIDTTDAIFDECRTMLREIIAEAPQRERSRLGHLSAINSVLRIAQSDRAVAIEEGTAVAMLRGEVSHA